MDEKWGIDFKKFKRPSSRKFMKGGLGFFLSPREETKDNAGSTSTLNFSNTKNSSWNNENANLQVSAEVQDKVFIDDVPIIPSLDDFADDELTNQISKAPLVSVKQVTNFKELEADLLQHSAFSSLEEVNLQILIKLLHPESCLEETDTPWSKESLFNEMVSQYNERKSQ